MAMRISDNGLAVLHYFEHCVLKAYPDPGSRDGKPWTIGWGHTGPDVLAGLEWTQAQADAAFVTDLSRFELGVARLVIAPLTQGQFDALVSLSYNIGLQALETSTLRRLVNVGDYEGASLQFPRWDKNDGKPLRGLTRRRYAEQALFRGYTGAQAISKGVAAA